jgi:ornithine--oxo-acid transaminase
MDRCFAHSSIFEQNGLVMVAGFATPHVLERENLVQRSAEMGAYLLGELRHLAQRCELISEVRNNGMMIGIEFRETRSLTLETGRKLLHSMNSDIFCQMITMPLMEQYAIPTQAVGHGLDTIRISPPLVMERVDADFFLLSLEVVLSEAHRLSGSAWTTTKNLALRTAGSA